MNEFEEDFLELWNKHSYRVFFGKCEISLYRGVYSQQLAYKLWKDGKLGD